MSLESTITKVLRSEQSSHLDGYEISFDRILVATDFSEPANQALKAAIIVGRLFGSKLFLVHAASPVFYDRNAGPIPLEILDANLDAAKEEINQLISCEPGLREFEPKVTVAYSNAVDLIAQVSREEKIELIVAGSHGANCLERLALGSVAEAILHRARCPVMIVGPNCRTADHLFHSLLFATDLTTTGRRGALFASGLAKRFHADLTLLHVMNEKPAAPHVEIEVIEARIKQQLHELLPPDVSEQCKAKVRLEQDRHIAKTIVTVADIERVTLMVVGLGNRRLADHIPRSILSYLIREAKCPVLGVRGHLA